MAWSVVRRAFVVEEFIQNDGSPVMTQHSEEAKCPVLVSQ
jgi:hypothetical protein